MRADPVICGHAHEARQLAEAAIAPTGGFASVHIVTYPLDVLVASKLPLASQPGLLSAPYSPGITVHRPSPLGSPDKVLDGRVLQGMTACLLELLTTPRLEGLRVVMGLYLVPHAQVVLEAARTARAHHARREQQQRRRDIGGAARDGEEGGRGEAKEKPATAQRRTRRSSIVTIAKAVGTDVTGHLTQAVARGEWGAAQLLLEQYLGHDVLLAVSGFTKTCLVEAAGQVDKALAARERYGREKEGEEDGEEDGDEGFYASELQRRVVVSYPPFDIANTQQEPQEEEKVMQDQEEEENQGDKDFRRQSRRTEIWSRYGVEEQKYVLFLSRWSEGKGLEDLVQGYSESKVCKDRKWPLLLCTTTPAAGEAMESSSAVSLAFASPRTPPPCRSPLSSTSSPASSSLTTLSSSTSSSPSPSSSSSASAPSSPSPLLERSWEQADQLQHLAPHRGSTISGDSNSTTGDTDYSSSSDGRLSTVSMPTNLIRIMEGVTDPDEKAALFSGCAAFVLPSKATPNFIETFGIVVVEKALAGGLGPVLTTRTGGLLEATGGHCVEIEPSSPKSITQQLDWVCNGGMDEAAKRAMAEGARKHALKFDRAKVLRELMSLVEG